MKNDFFQIQYNPIAMKKDSIVRRRREMHLLVDGCFHVWTTRSNALVQHGILDEQYLQKKQSVHL